MEEEIIVIEPIEEEEFIVIENDIEYIEPTTQEKIITPNQNQQIVKPDDGVFALSKVTVEAIPSDYVKPSGILEINSNGEYDVKEYEKTKVQLPSDVDKYFNTELNNNLYNSTNVFARLLIRELPDVKISSNSTSIEYGFANLTNCVKIGQVISNDIVTLRYFFGYDNILESVDLSGITSSDITNLYMAFNTCSKLKKIDLSNADFSKTTNISNAFLNCRALTDFNGLKNIGKGYTQQTANYNNYKFDISSCTSLTHDSLINIMNNLYNLNLTYDVANGGTLYTQQLILGDANKAKLTEEEIAIATNKGWTVS